MKRYGVLYTLGAVTIATVAFFAGRSSNQPSAIPSLEKPSITYDDSAVLHSYRSICDTLPIITDPAITLQFPKVREIRGVMNSNRSLEGLLCVKFNDGETGIGEYKNGKEHGAFMYFSRLGALQVVMTFNDGESEVDYIFSEPTPILICDPSKKNGTNFVLSPSGANTSAFGRISVSNL